MNYKKSMKQVSLHQSPLLSKSFIEAHFNQAVHAIIYLFLNVFISLRFLEFLDTSLYLQCM